MSPLLPVFFCSMYTEQVCIHCFKLMTKNKNNLIYILQCKVDTFSSMYFSHTLQHLSKYVVKFSVSYSKYEISLFLKVMAYYFFGNIKLNLINSRSTESEELYCKMVRPSAYTDLLYIMTLIYTCLVFSNSHLQQNFMMEESLDVQELFFTNLQLLGFNVERMEAQVKIPFNK